MPFPLPHEQPMTVNAPKIADPIAASPVLAAWLPALLSIAAVCAVFGLVFQREIVGAVKVWNASTAYNHCFLVLPLAGALLWMRRDVIAQLRPTPSWWPLALVPVLSAVWAIAALLDILEAEQLVVVALFETLLVAVLGWRVFRALLAPLLFLFFLVPFGAFLVPLLQRFTAAFTVRGLELLGIPVFADRFTIQIPAGVFEVAEACAGLRFLIASIVFGCFFATIVYRSMLRRLVFIGLAILLPIVANGFRALGLVLLAHFTGDGVAALADHIIYGWLFFTLVTLLLIAIGMTFVDTLRTTPFMPANMPVAGSRARITAIATAGLLLALAGPAYLYAIVHASAAPLAVPAGFAAPGAGDWVLQPAAADDWRPSANGAHRTTLATYRRGDATVTEFVALYRLPERGSPLTRTTRSVSKPEPWRLVDTNHATVSLGGGKVAVNTAKIMREGHQRLVWWFYVVDGQATASALDARFLQARAALRGGAHLGTLVALSTASDDIALAADTVLTLFLNALGRTGSAPLRHR
jgi:exosortase A